MSDAFPVVIIGGGLAGLAAAVHLAGRGVPPLVLEADSEYPGGRLSGGAAETFEHAGQTWSFDGQHGIHALWGGYDNMRAMLDRFTTIALRPSTGEEWINRWGKEVRAVEAGTAVRYAWLPAPFHYEQLLFRPRFWRTITPLDFLSLPGMLVSLMWVTGMDPLEEEIRLPGLGINEFFRGWTPNLRATFTGLAHSLLAAPAENISLTAFIAALRFYTILRRDVWHLDYLPCNPHDCLLLPLIEKIRAAEGDVLLGARAKKLIAKDGSWQIQFEDVRQGITRTLDAQHIILALDPPAAQDLLTTSPSTAERAARLNFPPALRNATIRLFFDAVPRAGAMGGMFTGDFLIDNFFWLHRMQDEFITWHQQTGGGAIEVHLYASETILNKPNELLIIEATKEVYAAFPELRGHFIHGVLRRNNATQTQFVIPTKQDSLYVETPWAGVYACGDWIGYPTPSLWMERSTITAIAAANAVLQNLDAEPYPIIPPRPPEPLVRILGGGVRLGRRLLSPLILGTARALKRLWS